MKRIFILAIIILSFISQLVNAETVDVKNRKGEWLQCKAQTVEELATSGQIMNEPETDKYGGWKVAKLKATGFFRVQKWQGRWWFVTPEGHPFISKAVATVCPGASTSPKQVKQCIDIFGSREAWRDSTINLLKDNGFNSAGNWSTEKLLKGHFPYAANVNAIKKYAGKYRKDLSKKQQALVVDDPAFALWFDLEVRKIAAIVKDDPYCMGYFVDNEIFWMGNAELYERYLKLVSKTLKKYDPNHLYLGSRFNKWKEELKDERFFKLAGKYLDVISINHYVYWEPNPEVFNRWAKWSGRPLMVTEFYVKAIDSGMPNTTGAGWLVKTQKDRGLFYQNFIIQLMKSPACVGWHWFKYQDNDITSTKADPSNLDSNKGIVSDDFVPYTAMLEKMKAANSVVYGLARKSKK